MKNIFFALWIAGGLTLLGVAVTNMVEGHRFKSRSISLYGEVVGSREASSSQRVTAPVVRYTHPSGQQREHTYSAPLAGNSYWIGEKVELLYDPESSEVKIDDWNELYLFPSLLAFAAILILLPPAAGVVIYSYFHWPRRKTS